MRTTTSTVTFTRPFLLPGFDQPHAPGSFDVKTDEERLDTVVEAWRRVATTILLVGGGRIEAWRVDPWVLNAAIAADAAPQPGMA
jgi:hypothetical protein